MSIFGGMRIYTVHMKPGAAHAEERPVFVKEGFNFYALFLTFFWALYHRLWILALLIFGFNLLLVSMLKNHVLSAPSVGILHLAMHVLVGLFANDWLRAGLARRGYIIADIAAADSMLRAEQRYFERYLAAT
jgi:hypothetical protein